MTTKQKPAILRFDEFRLDVPKRQLWRNEELVPLAAKAFDLLLALAENSGRVIPKDELLNLVWQDQFVEENNLTVHISAIRKALGDRAAQPRYIVTLAGRGYRFVADVRESVEETASLIVEERHTLTRVTVEEEQDAEEAEVFSTEPSLPHNQTPNARRALIAHSTDKRYGTETQHGTPQKARAAIFMAIATLLLLTAGGALAAYRYFRPQEIASPFERFEIKRETSSGNVLAAVVSPTGQYIAFAQTEDEGQSLWLKHIATNSMMRIVEPRTVDYWGLSFTPDGNYIYATTFERNQADPVLSKIPVLGGAAQQLPVATTAAVSFAPDGRRIAYVISFSSQGGSVLWSADADGANKRMLHVRKDPNSFSSRKNTVAWSPDGKQIACAVMNNTGDNLNMTVTAYDAETGAEIALTAQRWNIVSSVAWMGDGSGLILTGNERMGAPFQVWYVSTRDGQARQITNDLNSYSGVSIAGDGSVVTVQTDIASGIWTGAVNEEGQAENFRQEFAEVGEIASVAWLPRGNLIYQSSASGAQELWLLEAQSRRAKQLTFNSRVSYFAVSPDGEQVVLSSKRAGRPNLWQMDARGGEMRQLTNGDGEVRPRFAPDSRTVFYQKGFGDVLSSIWKISLDGSSPQPVTTPHQTFPDLSTDGKLLVYSYMDKSAPGAVRWRLGIAASADGKPLASFALPSSVTNRFTRWTPDNNSLTYINTVGGVCNLWLQPVGGGEARQLTDFTSHHIEAFDWSRDGGKLAIVRTLRTSDVVMLSAAR